MYKGLVQICIVNKDYFQSFIHISAQFTKRSVLNYVHYEWVGMNIVMALHVCVRLSVASRLSHSYQMELFVNCVIYNA